MCAESEKRETILPRISFALFPMPHEFTIPLLLASEEQAAISAALHLIAMGNKIFGRCFCSSSLGLRSMRAVLGGWEEM
jgi:hypothetical protein